MTATASFTINPKTLVDGGTIRVFPVIVGATAPFIVYAWTFGDGGTSSDPAPTHTYSGASAYTFSITYQAEDTFGTLSSLATGSVRVGLSASVSAVPTNGDYDKLSVFIYDDTYSMMVNRADTTFCSVFLLEPWVQTTIDGDANPSTSTFKLLVPEEATAIERSLIAEGKNVIVIQNKDIVFSGVIRRYIQDSQGGFTDAVPIKIWSIECDSDLAKLATVNLEASALVSEGVEIIDTPGYIARRILTPVTSGWDWRGNICCYDAVVSYQINPSTLVEQTPSQLDHMTKLRALTNYDLISRMDYEVYTYTSFNGTTTVTISGASLPTLTGYYVFFTNSSDGILTYGKITSNDGTTITCSAMVGAANALTTSDTIIVAKKPLIDFAPDLATPSAVATFNVNDTVFEYSDNDDKRKLSTKVIVKGKDAWGKNISVSLSGVHAYDNDRQFFNDATYITQKTEGYILKNSYVKQIPGFWTIGSGDIPAGDSTFFRGNPPYNHELLLDPDRLIPVGTEVTFDAYHLNPPLVAGDTYYCVEQNNTLYCKVSDTPGGTPIYLDSNGGYSDAIINVPVIPGPPTYFTVGELPITEGDIVMFTAEEYPTGINDYTSYTTNTVVKSGYGGTFKVNVTPTTAGATVSFYILSDVQNARPGYEYIPTIYLYGWNYRLFNGHAVTICYGNSVHSDTIWDWDEIITEDNIKATWVMLSGGKLFNETQIFSNGSYMLNSVQYINDITPVAYVTPIMIGEEIVEGDTYGVDNYGYYLNLNSDLRINSDTNKAYPHGVGALVVLNNYTEATPEEFSVVADYGLLIGTTTVETNTTYGELDQYATALLLGFGAFYKKATCWCPIDHAVVPRIGLTTLNPSMATMPRVGDTIAIVETTGATPENYEIVMLNIKYDEGKIEFTLGDYEKNVWSSMNMQTAAVNRTLT